MGAFQDLTGQTFGKLTVLEESGRIHGGARWKCQCECGRVVLCRAKNLKCGDSKTCGFRKECHHAWEGGHKNEMTIAWAKKKLTGMRVKALTRGHKRPKITPEEYLKVWEESGNKCQLCGKEKDDTKAGYLCVDHCHDTGLVRGVLCNNCNAGLGMFNDNLELMQKAIDYLKESQG